jgi:hypothetical protein
MLTAIECDGLVVVSGITELTDTSEDNSRAICVPLSRKSSQESVVSGTARAAGRRIDGHDKGLEGADFDAGNPGSLKFGFLPRCDSIVFRGWLGRCLSKPKDPT